MSEFKYQRKGITPEHPNISYDTTGLCGGNHSHGGSTTLELCLPFSCSIVLVDEHGGQMQFEGEEHKVRITVKGDWEIEGLDASLKSLGLALVARDSVIPEQFKRYNGDTPQ